MVYDNNIKEDRQTIMYKQVGEKKERKKHLLLKKFLIHRFGQAVHPVNI